MEVQRERGVMKVAALFVESDGPYAALEGVEAWDIARNAMDYRGPYPCVAHPPCQRWGRYAQGGPNPRARRHEIGADGGCFISALASVRSYGGVIEHPEATHAWEYHGIARPERGRWIRADAYGFTCVVAQGNYGHKARKLTWLYAVDCVLPELDWSIPTGLERMELGPQSKEHARAMRTLGLGNVSRLSSQERLYTPPPFRDLLLSMARSVYFVRDLAR